jgi:TonB family protein
LAAATALSGCATIIQGTTEPVSVATTPEQGAQCELKNSEGVWYLTSPGTTTVHKTKNDLLIDCTKPGFEPGHAVAVSHFGGTTVANVIAGGVIGIGVDAASGANYYYDSPITVALGASAQTASTGAPAPSSPTVPAFLDNAPPRIDKSKDFQPPYPDSAQVAGEQSDVVFNVRVGDDGKVRNIRVAQSSGFKDLDNAAVEGVMNWRFLPGTEHGDYTTQSTLVTIQFRLPTAGLNSAPSPASPGPTH